jgi:hypothetical protein|tara:strand:- start:3677 stop:3898 length:222 start_codon:yes stop_codon:yes gene_type:complete
MGGFVEKLTGQDYEPPQQAQRQAVREEPKGPTRAEMDQSRRIDVARRGRRATLLTSTKNVDQDLTLGTKTLLG